MKQNKKTRRASSLYTLAALLVVLMSNVYVGRAIEPDPRILWVADSSIGIIHGFAVHPNGNVFAYRNGESFMGFVKLLVYEIDGKNGKIIKEYPIFSDSIDTQTIPVMDISDDGRYIAIGGKYFALFDYNNNTIRKVSKSPYVKFMNNRNIVAYVGLGTKDSSIVILNLDNFERKFISTEEDIKNIAFSPDGKYMATGGTKEKSDGHYYTVFKIWDAQKLTFIKELKRYDNSNNSQNIIKFSPDSKTLCINSSADLLFFELNGFTLYQAIPKSFEYDFINDYLIVLHDLNVQKLIILNYIDLNEVAIIGNYNPYINLLYSSSNKSIIFDYLDKSNPMKTYQRLVCFDFDKVMSVSDNPISNDSMMIKYEIGNISIMNIPIINSNFNFNIADLGGKIVFEQSINNLNNDTFNIKLNLSPGIYFLNISNNSNSKTYKFLVTK